MTVPVLQAGDQIHMAVPTGVSGSMIAEIIEDYADRGVRVFRVWKTSSPDIEIVSIIRAPERPGPMNIMAAMQPRAH